MKCPACGHVLEISCRITAEQAAKLLGSKGGSAKGASKRRPPEHYKAMAAKRWESKGEQP